MEFPLTRFDSLSPAFFAQGPGAFVWGTCGDREFLTLALPGRRYWRGYPHRIVVPGAGDEWAALGPAGVRYAGDRDRPEFAGSLESQGVHFRIAGGVLRILSG